MTDEEAIKEIQRRAAVRSVTIANESVERRYGAAAGELCAEVIHPVDVSNRRLEWVRRQYAELGKRAMALDITNEPAH